MATLHSLRIWLLIIATSLFAGCAAPRPDVPGDGRLLVVASILPLADFARQVGGGHVRVETMVPPGASPHTYELVPSQLRWISRARILLLNGVGLEFWAQKVVSAAENPGLLVVTTTEGLPILAGEEHNHAHGGSHGHEVSGNPHLWLNPRYAMRMVERIRDSFAQADPGNAEAYRVNSERYLEELRRLDVEIRGAVEGFTARSFISFHAAWTYFAQEYGLVEAAVVEQMPGREPSPAEIAAIIRTARAIKARAIFAEPQLSPKSAQVIAGETGTQVLILNPLGLEPDYGYIDLMRYNLGEIRKALQ